MFENIFKKKRKNEKPVPYPEEILIIIDFDDITEGYPQ